MALMKVEAMELAPDRCSMHGRKCLDSSVHHFLKYHDPDSDFYLGTQCVACAFSDVQAKWEAEWKARAKS